MSRSGYASAAAVLLGALLLFGPASLIALAAAVAIVGVAADFVQWGLTHGYLRFTLAGVALLAAVSWAVVRTAGAFRDGYAGKAGLFASFATAESRTSR